VRLGSGLRRHVRRYIHIPHGHVAGSILEQYSRQLPAGAAATATDSRLPRHVQQDRCPVEERRLTTLTVARVTRRHSWTSTYERTALCTTGAVRSVLSLMSPLGPARRWIVRSAGAGGADGPSAGDRSAQCAALSRLALCRGGIFSRRRHECGCSGAVAGRGGDAGGPAAAGAGGAVGRGGVPHGRGGYLNVMRPWANPVHTRLKTGLVRG
jgi:hypothetical protein